MINTPPLTQQSKSAVDRPEPNRQNEAPAWDYETAFCRNQGILTPEEQEKLRNSRVAIIGQGGVGGVHLMTLARLGIGKFTIADPDRFELANFNRQYGATVNTIGRQKAEVMAEQALSINPELDIRVINEPISETNIDRFFDDAAILVDGVDFFAIDARRLVFAEARKRGLWAITCGPHAFGAAWQVFDPNGMSFDEFFDFRAGMSDAEKIVAFAVGCVPSPIHMKYLDMSKYFQPGAGKAGSFGLACHIASGVVGTEVARILLNRPGVRSAPSYGHFDAYRQKLVRRKCRWGNRHPWQQLKRWWLTRLMQSK
jgi:molybdopterin/thiamine biosynthesis adenylyltransferase